jgi:hypothetical protein
MQLPQGGPPRAAEATQGGPLFYPYDLQQLERVQQPSRHFGGKSKRCKKCGRSKL